MAVLFPMVGSLIKESVYAFCWEAKVGFNPLNSSQLFSHAEEWFNFDRENTAHHLISVDWEDLVDVLFDIRTKRYFEQIHPQEILIISELEYYLQLFGYHRISGPSLKELMDSPSFRLGGIKYYPKKTTFRLPEGHKTCTESKIIIIKESTMYEEEKRKLLKTHPGFNHFFADLQPMMKKIGRSLQDEFHFTKIQTYSPGSNRHPYMPNYYGLFATRDTFSLQVLIILNSNEMIKHKGFVSEPSIIVIKHFSQKGWYRFEDYTLLVLTNVDSEFTKIRSGAITGLVTTGPYKGANYYAFQVPLDPFIESESIAKVIDQEIITPINNLPPK